MGNKGTTSTKAKYDNNLLVFTRWGEKELKDMSLRSSQELSSNFSLRKFQLEFLLGAELIGFLVVQSIFQNILDPERKGFCDKFEVMCLVCLLSRLSDTEKVEYLFDIFNFNSKGYLLESEMSLLLVSVVNGALKADKLVLSATLKTISLLVHHALAKFALISPSSIRKPELIKFASDTKDVRAFITAWRGHSGAVLLSANELWRDVGFPANQTSITPSSDWLKFGLPPAYFVKWMRIKEVCPILGDKVLFSHTSRILKTIDRRSEFGGPGLLGQGTIKRNLIADKWFMNAVAAMTCRPQLLMGLFSATSQESIGRYCIKVFEGLSWKFIFFDDRIPCGPDGCPLFGQCSDPNEMCLLLLQKGFAKYLGSYGHLGLCGSRADSTQFALRYFTGGHVMRYFIEDYDWKTIETDCVKPDGVKVIERMFHEGALVSFGLSEVKLYHRSTMSALPAHRMVHGHLFPLVAIEYSIEDNYKYFILRDAFGLLNTNTTLSLDISADRSTGVCRTFRYKVENIPTVFDTIFVSRFPDMLRYGPEAEKLRLQPWHTEYISQPQPLESTPPNFQDKQTQAQAQPEAVFMLEVIDNNPLSLNSTLKGDNIPSLSKLKNSNDEIKSRKAPPKTINDSLNDEHKSEKNKSQFNFDDSDFVDIAFTLASCMEWVVAGNPAVGARMKIAVVPCQETRKRLRKRSILKQIREINQAQMEAARIVAEKKLLADLSSSELITEENFEGKNKILGDSDTGMKASEEDKNKEQYNKGKYKIVKERFDLIFAEESCWISQSLKLLPGKYYIFAYCSFTVPYAVLVKQRIQKESSLQHELHLQLSSHGRFLVTTPPRTRLPRHNVNLHTGKVEMHPQHWPFLAEAQQDVCSSGLYEMLDSYKREVVLLESEQRVVLRDLQDLKTSIKTASEASSPKQQKQGK